MMMIMINLMMMIIKIDDDVYLPVLASASPFVALSSAPARGRIVAERAPRGPDGRLKREYLPDDDDDDGHDDADCYCGG